MLRLLQRGTPRVAGVLARHPARAPELIRLEVANGLATGVRVRRISPPRARDLFRAFGELSIEMVPSEAIAHTALDVSIELGTSVYDATYLVLARWRDTLLLTADKRLAALAGRAELVE